MYVYMYLYQQKGHSESGVVVVELKRHASMDRACIMPKRQLARETSKDADGASRKTPSNISNADVSSSSTNIAYTEYIYKIIKIDL